MGLGGNARSEVINIYTNTSDPTNVGATNLSLRDDGDDSYDGVSLIAGKKNPELEISSMDPGFRASVVDAPQYTTQYTFDLAIGPNFGSSKITTGPLDEILNFQIPDNTDLDGYKVVAYNLANPSVEYVIPQDGTFLTLTLPKYIANGTSGVFDHWEIDISPVTVPEPSTLSLFGAGALAAGAGAYVSRRRREEPLRKAA